MRGEEPAVASSHHELSAGSFFCKTNGYEMARSCDAILNVQFSTTADERLQKCLSITRRSSVVRERKGVYHNALRKWTDERRLTSYVHPSNTIAAVLGEKAVELVP